MERLLLDTKFKNKSRNQTSSIIMQTTTSQAYHNNTYSANEESEKHVNRTWEAFGKYKGAFVILDPSILD